MLGVIKMLPDNDYQILRLTDKFYDTGELKK